MSKWHPENLTRGRIYLFHVDIGSSVELIRMLFDQLEIRDRTLCLTGIDQRTKSPTSLAVRSVAQVQTIGG